MLEICAICNPLVQKAFNKTPCLFSAIGADMCMMHHYDCVRALVCIVPAVMISSSFQQSLAIYGDVDLIHDLIERGLRFANTPLLCATVKSQRNPAIRRAVWKGIG